MCGLNAIVSRILPRISASQLTSMNYSTFGMGLFCHDPCVGLGLVGSCAIVISNLAADNAPVSICRYGDLPKAL